ncbi:MAG: hypothetical protein EYC69_09270 [Bacteroidetes bacterium]|nr:MAG: hypothetical protein EYC69_09270 [Bacteroidota bacterium]
MKKYFYLLLFFCATCSFSLAQDGSSYDKSLVLFPSTSCSNSVGSHYTGQMQCLTADCSSYYTMGGKSSSLNPACSEDDERYQSVLWIKVRATADNFTINNGSAYIGSGAAASNTKDYTVYSGTYPSIQEIACYTLTANTSATITGLSAGKDYFILASPAITQTRAEAISLCITSTKAYEASGNNCTEAVPLEMNSVSTFNNAGATPDGPSSNTSLENNTWYKWTAPSGWPSGQAAYVRIFEPLCNSNEALQINLWTTQSSCPDNSDKYTIVSQAPGQKPEYYHQWTPVPGNTYFISVDGYAGTACQFKLELASQSIIPVNLITLEAKSDGKNVLLSWVTSEESNNNYFTIEKSRDGQHFLPLTNVEGAGKSTTERSYTSRDEFPYPEKNYYRLKQTDSEGNYSYSQAIAVNIKGQGSMFHASSGKGSDKIDLSFFSENKENAMLRIFDTKGQQLYSMNLPLNQGRNDYKINSSLFPFGKYQVKLETAGTIQSGDILLEEE